jgi:hypothetical protein
VHTVWSAREALKALTLRVNPNRTQKLAFPATRNFAPGGIRSGEFLLAAEIGLLLYPFVCAALRAGGNFVDDVTKRTH